MKTENKFNSNSLVLPKINDLSNNLKLTPLNKNAIKTILIFKEEMTSPKQKLIKENKKTHLKLKSFIQNETKNINYNFSISTNDFLSSRISKEKKLIYKNYIKNKKKKKKTNYIKIKYKFFKKSRNKLFKFKIIIFRKDKIYKSHKCNFSI